MKIADREILRRLTRTYDLSCVPPQPINSNLRNIAKIIAARPDDQTCIADLTAYLLLNGIPVEDQERPKLCHLDFPEQSI